MILASQFVVVVISDPTPKEGESTSINGRIKGYGDPGASLSAALGVVGGSISNNVSIDHDAIWGETSISSNWDRDWET